MMTPAEILTRTLARHRFTIAYLEHKQYGANLDTLPLYRAEAVALEAAIGDAGGGGGDGVSTPTEKPDNEEFAYGCALLVLLVPFYAYESFAFRQCWMWFAVPLGAPAIGVAHTLGLLVIFGCLRHSVRHATPPAKKMFFDAIAMPTWMLALGALAHWWMVRT